jgi:hypothetical protein
LLAARHFLLAGIEIQPCLLFPKFKKERGTQLCLLLIGIYNQNCYLSQIGN